MIKDLLQKGKENRISFDELKELTGCSNERTLRKMIADERRQGVLISSAQMVAIGCLNLIRI